MTTCTVGASQNRSLSPTFPASAAVGTKGPAVRFRAKKTSAPRGSNTPRPIFVIAEQLVQLWIITERELAELESLRVKGEKARSYLRSAGSNALLGRAHLHRIETAYRTHLDRLQALQKQARELIDRLDREPGPALRADAARASGRPAGPGTTSARTPSRHCWIA
jgi:hypothetical protein